MSMASRWHRRGSATVERMDRKLALAFGAIILALMLIVAGTASRLYNRLNRQEEDRLAGTIARVLDQAINKVAFSGKYHTRLLLEEMKASVPDLAFISVEDADGRVIAHSDPSRNGTVRSPSDMVATPAVGAPRSTERLVDGRHIKEVAVPYRGGLGGNVLGTIHVGITTELARQTHRRNLAGMLVLTALLTISAMWVVLLLSRGFGGAVRALAVQLQGIADSLPGVIYRFHLLADGSVRMVFTSQAAMHLFGLGSARPEDFLVGFTAGLQADDQARFDESIRAAAAARSPWHFGARFTRSDGSTLWFHCIAQIASLADGTTEFSGVLLDITERQRAEEDLWRSREILKAVLDSITVRVFWKDTDLNYLGCNLAFARDAGFEEPEQVIGRSDFDVVWRAQAEMYRSADYEVIATGTPRLLYEEPLTTGSGETVHVLTSKVPLRDAQGAVIGVLGTYLDITERKRADAQRDELQAQLVQAQKMESVGRLAGGVAHDFNNMLGVILGHAEMAMQAVGPLSPVHADLEQITQAARRSADLTRQLLAFARKQTVTPRVLDLNTTVEGMLRMLKRLIGENIELAWRPGANLPRINMDPSQLDQILANLCVNARDAIDGVGQVTIETALVPRVSVGAASPDSEHVRLSVTDTGCGMDRETISHIYEPFYTTKSLGQGTGLGLATVYGIVTQNSGLIDVDSAPGRGTTFHVYLPALPALPVGANAEDAPPRTLPAQGGQEIVLLVEDEPAILRMVSVMLERLGYRVLPAARPSEAIRLAGQHAEPIDLLLTDVIMPEMTGRDLANQLLARHAGLKVLFMSGYTGDVLASRGVIDDGVNFIGKPFTAAELAAGLRQLLGS
ncbi:MAG: PAS domain-containing protein [Armatimonadetes bacterium]|nr:PAS domain-containing protein [Armatimonadota bacterium]